MHVDGAAEKQRWRRNAAAWRDWAEDRSESADKLNQPLLDAVGLKAGHKHLDLASGVGEPLISAMRRVGENGVAIGSDLAPEMLTAAAERLEKRSLAIRLCGADMTRLPFADDSFDTLTCRFGLMFVPDMPAALHEIRRVLRPGGRCGMLVWGPRENNTMFDVVYSVVRPVIERSDLPDIPQFRYGDREALLSDLHKGGFADATITDMKPVQRLPLDPPFWYSALDMGCRAVINELPADERALIDAQLRDAFSGLAVNDPEHGRVVTLAMHVVMISAQI